MRCAPIGLRLTLRSRVDFASQPLSSASSCARCLSVVPLSWVEAGRQHLPDLQHFICTYPARPAFNGTRLRYHPARWEFDVQCYLRSQYLPKAPPDYMILGYDSMTLEAVVLYGRDDLDEYWIIDAVARRIGSRGRGVGDEALEEALRRIDAEGRHGIVTAHIHKSNAKSKALFTRAGFAFAYFQDAESVEEVWVLDRSARGAALPGRDPQL